jgi:ArsR family transcriptional regulator
MTSDVFKDSKTIFDKLVESFVSDTTRNSRAESAAAGVQVTPPIDLMFSQAEEASAFLKALAHEGRLMILCSLVHGEKSVTELENLLNSRQAAVSQQLARLRLEGIVSARRDGKTIYYSLRDPKVQEMIGLLYKMFCLQN